ncbi:MAG: hypothetical protein ACTHV2_10565 [Brachybacterium sp.]|uniref:hypothetical protein n=1 Tax=Brachybacterium sp. TaxID=1891286 RepID=UPI00264F788D|nr:hypothetical protein [Brachybacterium sp.]
MASHRTASFTAAPLTDARDPSARASSWALALALLALIGGAAVMGAVGATVPTMEAESGYYFSDTPGWYQGAVLAGFGSLLVWSVAGIAAIVLAVLGLRAGGGRARAITAIVLAVLAPALSLAVLLAAMGAGVALL